MRRRNIVPIAISTFIIALFSPFVLCRRLSVSLINDGMNWGV